MLLDAITLIASAICALSAVTISLRALGKSREYSGKEQQKLRKDLSIFRISTIIWYVLSFFFAVPILAEKWAAKLYAGLMLWALLFLVLLLALWGIWKKVESCAK
ncbi:MAG TPA: hypothetical protein ENG95_03910 [Nitrospirae bacterium]|nr:hypothetical protein BMS3Abin10_01982 [bacterium BMS3Abin10]GBE38056.1 hypothetical protein BMS3Bbin08_00655 [bacterium BMS3Bbin08]HDH50782.1 hypothetical protein [Nitrospirota bacterium]HDK17018.1 hypothetical protein [Nitrospirota bacterium]HDK81820.1 hypothetical protein [Nitrospirota bacterium]